MKEAFEVVRDALDKSSVKEVAASMGVSHSLVYKWGQRDECDDEARAANPVERVAKLFELTGDEQLIQWLCHRAGGFFVRNPPSECKRGFEVVPATQEIVQQFADLLGTISKAAQDNAITDHEAGVIRQVWNELKRYTEGFVKCCEEGDFANLRAWAVKAAAAGKKA